MPACQGQASLVKEILTNYAASIGLKIHFHKSTLVPSNCDVMFCQPIAQIFGCTIGKMTITYLDLPLGTTRSFVQDLMPLVCHVERRLSSTLSMICYGGKLSLLNSVITSLIIFPLCTLKFLPKITERLDKIRRSLWMKK